MKVTRYIVVTSVVLVGAGFALWRALDLLDASGPSADERDPDAVAESSVEGRVPRPAFGADDHGEGGESAPSGSAPSFSWTDHNATGVAALDDGDVDKAITCFEECLAAVPEQDVYAKNLAEALARKATGLHDGGDEEERAQAIVILERAVQVNPRRKPLADVLARWRRSADAEEDFFREGTEHFEVSYDLDRDDVRSAVQAICRRLEEAYQDFGEYLGIRPADDPLPPIRVVLYTREDFDEVTGIGDWAGGVYDGTIRVPVTDLSRELPRLERVLRHELLHAFVQEGGGRDVPGWLNEGIAQFLENDQLSARAHYIDTARNKLAGAELFALSELSGSLATWKDTAAIERAYAQALALVAYIEDMYGADVLYEMVTGCKGGSDPSATFEKATFVSLESVIEDLANEL